MFEQIVRNQGNKFYRVKDGAIADAQEELGIVLPKELTEFYTEVGYGFLYSKEDNFNRIMDPQSVCDFRLRAGQFAGYSELDIYDSYERNRVIFFEICEGNYLSIGFAKSNQGKVFYGKKKIANSLKDFLIQYQQDEHYFE